MCLVRQPKSYTLQGDIFYKKLDGAKSSFVRLFGRDGQNSKGLENKGFRLCIFPYLLNNEKNQHRGMYFFRVIFA